MRTMSVPSETKLKVGFESSQAAPQPDEPIIQIYPCGHQEPIGADQQPSRRPLL